MSANENSPPMEAAAASTPRSRLPRWTRHETLVLIQARRAMEWRGLQQPVRPRPKWAAVSAYCRRHGVERGPMQCRKRWGNLSWDLKKIVAWEGKAAATGPQHESFWDMRGEQRRARQLPSSFDREVYDALVCGTAAGADAAVLPDFGEELDGVYEQPPIMVVPISARKYEYEPPPPASSEHDCSDPVTECEKKAGAASDKNSASQQNGGGGFKGSDATFVAGAEGTTAATPAATVSIGKQVMAALERGNRALAHQLESQRTNWDADREQRTALLAALERLADAVARIADML
ncbi:trihelix transcription factor ASR3-like [Phragmites australis]|uniref:trihelix transcription factor ASR3-like n=1 Tax=Phragmites australis TaxID=29695 RepID=UPI002D78D32E|nr:trihelix transcription factor ASR3-like [Phragmites australis]